MIDASLARRLVDSQFPQWRSCRSRRSRSTAGTTAPSASAPSSPSGCRAATGTPAGREGAALAAGARPAAAAAHPGAGGAGAPDSGSRTRGRSTAGSRASSPRSARIDDLPALRDGARGVPERAAAGSTRPAARRPGEHNFFRGGPLATYEGEALEAIDALGGEVPPTPSSALGGRDGHRSGTAIRCGSTATSPPGTSWSATDVSPPCSTSARRASAIPRATSSSPGPSCRARAATASAPSSASTPAPGRAAAGGRCGRR